MHRRPGYSPDGLTFVVTGFAFVHDPVHDTAGDIRLLLASMTPDAAREEVDSLDDGHAHGAIRLVRLTPARNATPRARGRRPPVNQPA